MAGCLVELLPLAVTEDRHGRAVLQIRHIRYEIAIDLRADSLFSTPCHLRLSVIQYAQYSLVIDGRQVYKLDNRPDAR